MIQEKADEIMSKILGYWDSEHGLEHCDGDVIYFLYKSMLTSPHDNGLMPTVKTETGQRYEIPMEEIVLFGLEGKEVSKLYEQI